MIMKEKWPTVHERDDGIRPAGPRDQCFCCGQKIGEPHKRDCAIIDQKVRLRYIFEIEADVPHFWGENEILFHRNEGSWCASNAIDELDSIDKKEGCLCKRFKCEFVEIVDDTPRRAIRTKEEMKADEQIRKLTEES